MIGNNKLSQFLKIKIVILLSLCISMPALIAEEEEKDEDAPQLRIITVTAQKREQSLQDVPISISVLDSEILDNRNITSFENLEIPGVHIGQGEPNDKVYIRGIGTTGGRGFAQSVPIYHDGVYLSRARQQRVAFLDVENIQVLKGPQPTFLGKNAIGGAISITSRRPTEDFEGVFELTNEFEHNELTAFFAVSGPVSDNFRVRAAFKYRDIEGWVKNITNNRDGPSETDKLFRISAEWDVSEDFNIYFKYDHAEISTRDLGLQKSFCYDNDFHDPALEDCVLDEQRAVIFDDSSESYQFARSLGIIPDFIGPNDTDKGILENDSYLIIAEWNNDDYVVTSSTSYYEFDNDQFQKVDVSTFPVAFAHQPELLEHFSQEIRIVSPYGADNNIDWLLGAYYDESDTVLSSEVVLNLFATRGVNNPSALAAQLIAIPEFKKKSESWAVFGEIGYDINDVLRTTFGFRFTDIQSSATNKTVGFLNTPAPPPPGPFPPATVDDSASTDETSFQPSIGLEYRSSDDVMWYASYKKGFKAGGPTVRIQASNTLTYGPETVKSFEVGSKMRFLDGSATLNMSLFNSKYTDLQVNTVDADLSIVSQNAGESTSQGFEADFVLAVSENVNFYANVTFLNASYDEFTGVACHSMQTEAEGCIPPVGGGRGSQDLSGASLLFSPDLSANVALEYFKPLDVSWGGSNLELSTRLDIFYTDSFQTDAKNDPHTVQESYNKIDLRIALGSQDGDWSIAFIGRNLTNEFTSHSYKDTGGGGGFAYSALLDRTRQLGVQLRYNF